MHRALLFVLVLGALESACGVGFTEGYDFAPRRPGPPRPPKPAASLEIVPEGAPACPHDCIGTVFYTGRAALLGQAVTGGGHAWETRQQAECANRLRQRAAELGGDGIYDLAIEGPRRTNCSARVYVCTESRP